MFTAKDIAALREKTGVGMMDCKNALTEADGNFDKAIEILREKGLAAANKKSSRIAAEGVVTSYIHMGGKIGVLVEINCETDFCAKSEPFNELAKDIAMQIAAAKPSYVARENVPEEVVADEKKILLAQTMNEGKPAQVAERIVEGRVNKFFKDICLLEQDFVKDGSKTVQQFINEAILRIGEKITVRRFVRYEMGEGLAKREENFAEEVAKQTGKK